MQHAEASVLQEFPRGCIFLKKVFACEDCAEDCELNQTILLLPSVMIVYFVQ